jgi:hypothetical protein
VLMHTCVGESTTVICAERKWSVAVLMHTCVGVLTDRAIHVNQMQVLLARILLHISVNNDHGKVCLFLLGYR